ncbi:unnamed protein product [Heligmosomoides polygyrus]|uniref:Tektin n=1 Tax=Heligmosomoides polygyrus TaxID=6339 RepID=A0A183GAV8_HELPZ|nr:unnamed protein product [Heligmosomoides polygyrus]
MVLKPLEFSECLADTPWFRQNLHEHEVALEDAYKSIKNIETQCRELISCTRTLLAEKREHSHLQSSTRTAQLDEVVVRYDCVAAASRSRCDRLHTVREPVQPRPGKLVTTVQL